MTATRRSLLFAACLSAAAVLPAGELRAELVLPRPSPLATSKQTVGNTELTITYSRPGVKGRVIWGELVPFDAVWRTGANEANAFTTTDEITVGGQKLAAGTYSVLTLPTKGDWTVILSTQKGLMGTSNYDAKNDAVRFTVKPETGLPNQEWMWMGFDDLTTNSANLVLRWEKLRVAIPISVDVNNLVLADCRAELAAAKADDWRLPLSAARWCFDNSVALDEGKGWLDKSIAIQKSHSALNLKARWLHKEGKKAEAIAAAKDAIATGKASKDPVDVSASEKLVADWSK